MVSWTKALGSSVQCHRRAATQELLGQDTVYMETEILHAMGGSYSEQLLNHAVESPRTACKRLRVVQLA
eukprot:COSAG02_NODE_9362_length_2242_cov_25.855190_3_plen_69_part_00